VGGDIAFRAQLVIPEQRQLYDYWVARAGGRAMPDRSDISPSDFPRLLPFVSLIDIERSSGRCKVRLAGTRLRDIYDRETTGLYVDDLDWGDKRDYWLAAYARILDDGKPAQGVVRGPRVQKEHLVQFWLRLPLGVEGGRVGMVLSYDMFQSASEYPATTQEQIPIARYG
jgi:PAS domain